MGLWLKLRGIITLSSTTANTINQLSDFDIANASS